MFWRLCSEFNRGQKWKRRGGFGGRSEMTRGAYGSSGGASGGHVNGLPIPPDKLFMQEVVFPMTICSE